MDIADLQVHDAIEGAAGRLPGVMRNLIGKVLGAVQSLWPQVFGTCAVPDPADHGAAGGGSFVMFTWPFVVFARHFIEHARADETLDTLGGELKINSGRQREARAGAFRTLI